MLQVIFILQNESGINQTSPWRYWVMDEILNIERAWSFCTVLYMQLYTVSVTQYRDPWVGEDI